MMQIRGLEKSFAGVPAIKDFSMEIHDDEYVTMLGPSGSGKTTLLRLIAGLDEVDDGDILLDGKSIVNQPPHVRGLGFVQQNYALFPLMSVYDNVAFGLRYRQFDAVSDESEVQRRCRRILELVGLEGLEDRNVNAISGGQKQRVSLARTLVTEPNICLLDEPLGALDANLRERMTVELRRIRSALGVTFVHVTGNETEALAMGDRMIVLDAGQAIQIAPPGEIFKQPASVDVARFVNKYNVLQGMSQANRFMLGWSDVDMASGIESAAYYAVRHDRIELDQKNDRNSERTGFDAEYVTSEFLGSRVVHFFRLPDDSLFEVENHLSKFQVTSGSLKPGHSVSLSWQPKDALLFGENRARITHNGEGVGSRIGGVRE